MRKLHKWNTAAALVEGNVCSVMVCMVCTVAVKDEIHFYLGKIIKKKNL